MSNARSRLAAYGRTPKALLRDGSISAGAKIVYAMVDEVAGHEDITIKRLEEWLGVSEKTAKKYLHEIRDTGWVEVIEVIEGQRGQRPSEYVANAYSFQHVSERQEESSSPQVADQARHQDQGALSSRPSEESAPPPSQNVPSAPVEQTGGSKTAPPRGGQKVGGPTYVRDDETVTTTQPAPSDGFKEFWAAFPDGGYKGRREECRKFWLALPIEDRHAAYKMLMKYRTSVLWVEQEKIPTPYQWLTNETWTGDPPRQVPPRPKMLTADDIRLPD